MAVQLGPPGPRYDGIVEPLQEAWENSVLAMRWAKTHRDVELSQEAVEIVAALSAMLQKCQLKARVQRA